MTTAANNTTPLQLIERAQDELSGVRARWELLSAFQKELHKRTKGKAFVIGGWATWQALMDARDMMVVHFAAWAQSAYSPGGLFGKLQARSGQPFHVKARPTAADRPRGVIMSDLPDDEQEAILSAVAKASHQAHWRRFAKLFPHAAEAKRPPNFEDFDTLRQQFQDGVEAVVNDRNHFRAHPTYGSGKRKTATDKMLNLENLQSYLEYAFNLLNDLRLLCDRSAVADDAPHVQREAEDLVDQVLFGNRRRMDALTGLSKAAYAVSGKHAYQFRDDFYRRLNEHCPKVDKPFNHPSVLKALRKNR